MYVRRFGDVRAARRDSTGGGTGSSELFEEDALPAGVDWRVNRTVRRLVVVSRSASATVDDVALSREDVGSFESETERCGRLFPRVGIVEDDDVGAGAGECERKRIPSRDWTVGAAAFSAGKTIITVNTDK